MRVIKDMDNFSYPNIFRQIKSVEYLSLGIADVTTEAGEIYRLNAMGWKDGAIEISQNGDFLDFAESEDEAITIINEFAVHDLDKKE